MTGELCRLFRSIARGLVGVRTSSFRLLLFALSGLLVAGQAAAQVPGCNRLIELSKLKSQTFTDSSSFAQEHRALCQEYAQFKSSGKAMSAGGSYKLVSANFGQSSSSVESVASQYCEDNGSLKSASDAYRNYVETIAPGAYESYNACLQLASNKITFSLSPAAIQATNAAFLVSNNDVGAGASNTMKYTTSPGVTCNWDRAAPAAGLRLIAGSAATLSCSRTAIDQASFVMIFASTLPNSAVTIPWEKYENGAPANVVAQFQDATGQLNQFIGSLRGSVVAFNTTVCPAGWTPYVPAQGRFIRGIRPDGDKTVDPDGTRSPGNLQNDGFKSHDHTVTEMVHNDAEDGVDSAVFPSFEHRNKARRTGVAGGLETRPKNVALLYCERR